MKVLQNKGLTYEVIDIEQATNAEGTPLEGTWLCDVRDANDPKQAFKLVVNQALLDLTGFQLFEQVDTRLPNAGS